MGQNQSAKPTNSQPQDGSSKTSVIAKGTVIEGSFNANDNLRIDGTIIGSVNCQKRLVIGATGFVKGKVEAAEISIEGKVEGEVTSQGMARLGGNSRFEGLLIARQMEINEGAVFNGDFQVGNKK